MREWTIKEFWLIAERVMEWQVFEFRGRLWLRNFDERPRWMTSSEVPDWPTDPAAAAMALGAWVSEGGRRYDGGYDMMARRYTIVLYHQSDGRYPVEGIGRTWSEAVMLAILAAVEG